jgi:predicted ATPase
MGGPVPTREGPLRFTSIHLENWRNFRSVDEPLHRRVFLVGPNASGKSNLLGVFRFLRDLASVGGGLQEAVRSRGGVSSLRCLAARAASDIVVKVGVAGPDGGPSWTYELRIGHDARLRRPIVKTETVRRDDREDPVIDRPDDADTRDRERLTQTHLEQVNANRDFRQVAEFLGTVRYLHIVPQLVRDPDRSVGRADDPYGGDFLHRIARTPAKTRDARLRRIGTALRVAVPNLDEIEFRQDERGTPHLRGRYAHWRPNGAWQTEELFSDGTLRLLGLLWTVLDGTGPLLLEEPELSLHPEVVRFVPQLLARMQGRTGRQVILSTHSPDLLRDGGIGLDEVLLLRPGREGTEVFPAASKTEIRALLENGVDLADAILPWTRPEKAEQLPLFGDDGA